MACTGLASGKNAFVNNKCLQDRNFKINSLRHTASARRLQQDAIRRTTCAQASTSRATPDLFEEEVHGSWVIAPPQGRPKGTVHFLGGAFAGASPQLIYPLLLQLLARAGYTVISTPYAVTFKHLAAASSVHQKFNGCIDTLRRTGQGWLVPDDQPIHGIGHSNGALLHLLIGSIYAPVSASNVLISFNNKQVKDAIPMSLGPIQTAVAQLRSQRWVSGIPSADGLISGAMGALTQSGLMLDERALKSVAPALDQLYSVFNEVGDGTVEFEPTPAESRSLIGSAYRVPYSLLVRFENDAIDETPEMSRILCSANPAGTTSVTLPGTHITPCGGDVAWQVGRSFSAVDAVALGVKAVVQADVRRLGDRLIGWLDSHR